MSIKFLKVTLLCLICLTLTWGKKNPCKYISFTDDPFSGIEKVETPFVLLASPGMEFLKFVRNNNEWSLQFRHSENAKVNENIPVGTPLMFLFDNKEKIVFKTSETIKPTYTSGHVVNSHWVYEFKVSKDIISLFKTNKLISAKCIGFVEPEIIVNVSEGFQSRLNSFFDCLECSKCQEKIKKK